MLGGVNGMSSGIEFDLGGKYVVVINSDGCSIKNDIVKIGVKVFVNKDVFIIVVFKCRFNIKMFVCIIK